MLERTKKPPACRVCGCTEDRACEDGCAWAPIPHGEAPLCTACVGTAGDLAEVMGRIARLARTNDRAIVKMASDALARHRQTERGKHHVGTAS